MSVTYTIEHRSAYAGQSRGVVANRKRRDAAHRALYAAVYDMLRAESLLDRPVAVRLANEVNALALVAPQRGASYTRDFVMDYQMVRVTARND